MRPCRTAIGTHGYWLALEAWHAQSSLARSARAPQVRCAYPINRRLIKAAPQELPTSAPDLRHVVAPGKGPIARLGVMAATCYRDSTATIAGRDNGASDYSRGTIV